MKPKFNLKKQLLLCLFSLPISWSYSQTSVIEMLNGMNPENQFSNMVLKNHVATNYMVSYEENFDKKIRYNDEDVQLAVNSIDSVTYDGSELRKYSKIYDAEKNLTPVETHMKINDKKQIFFKKTEYKNNNEGVAAFLNEELFFEYNDAGKMTKVRVVKPLQGSDVTMMNVRYSNDKWPDELAVTFLTEMKLIKSVVNDTIIYTEVAETPQELIDMLKEEIGHEPSKEELKEHLGPFISDMKQQSKIIRLDDKTYQEMVYKTGANGTKLVSSVIFNSDWHILSINKPEEESTVLFSFHQDGRTKSVNANGSEFIFEYDASNRPLKKCDNNGQVVTVLEYDGDNLVRQTEISFNSIMSYTEYTYPDK